MFAKKALLGAAAALTVLTLAGCSTPDSHEPADLQDFREMVSPKVSWTASVGESDGYLTPAVTDNAVYAAGGSSLYRLDRHTGDKVWEAEAGSRIVAGVGTDGMHQAVVTDRGEVEVYDAEGKVHLACHALRRDGRSAARRPGPRRGEDLRHAHHRLRHRHRRTPLALSGARLPRSRSRPSTRWPGPPRASSPVRPTAVFSPSASTASSVFDAVIGQAAGITEVERLIDVVGRPWVDNQLMCAAAFQGNLVCMSSTNGQLVWNAKVDSVTGPVADARMVYVVDDQSYVHAYNRANGREAWVNRDLEYRTVSAPIRIGATVAVADYKGYVTMMNPANGEVVGRTRLDGAVRAPAAQFGYGAVFQTVEGEVAYVLQESLGE